MKHFLQFIIVVLFVSHFLSAQNLPTENVRSPKDRSLRSHFQKKSSEKFTDLRLHNVNSEISESKHHGTHNRIGLLPHNQHSFSKTSSGVDTAWVRHYGSGLVPSTDRAKDIVVDNAGNVYVTGESGEDYATIKYNSQGAVVWLRRYNGPGNGRDEPTSIAVEGNGNVFVTGLSYGSNDSYDYATIKYNSNGDMVWVKRDNGHDTPASIAVDGSGNVFVTGSSYGSGSFSDYATIKYNANGDSLWVRRYSGPGGSDFARSLVVDVSGNIYVTGSSQGLGTYYDYVTIKYNTDGDTLWVRRYNNEAANNFDFASSLQVDVSGNVYVTGSSYSPLGSDYATVKYNSKGDTLWVRRYNAGNGNNVAASIAIDQSGNVYVTGSSSDSGNYSSYSTIKYGANGDTLWEKRYKGLTRRYDRFYLLADEYSNSIAIDVNGNVYVTGSIENPTTSFDYATIKYNANGDTLWVRKYDGLSHGGDFSSSIAIDISGNIYVAGISDCIYDEMDDYYFGGDFATIKYNANGDILWVQSYNGPGNNYDYARSLTIDGNRNVYITGNSLGAGTGDDYSTIKYNSAGDTVWVRRYNGPGNGGDYARSVAFDVNGNVYVTGSSNGLGTSYDYATIKYNATGEMVWVKRYNGAGNSNDVVASLAVDVSGNVYVTGSSGSDYATIKYNSAGDTLWVRRYNSGSATSLAIDESSNVYVTGSSGTGYPGSNDFATIKYNSSGDLMWVRRYNGPSNNDDFASSLAIDAIGNVCVTGESKNSDYTTDYATIKYTSNGDMVWLQRYNGPGNGNDTPASLAVDASGNVYVTGCSYLSPPFINADYATIKYNTAGDSVWVRRYNGPGNSDDFAKSIAVDASGNVFVTGKSQGSNIGGDYATIKYNSSGGEEWVSRYTYGSSHDPCRVIVDNAGNVFVAGSSTKNDLRSTYWSVYSIIKYIQKPNAVRENNLDLPTWFGLDQNYPNPFNPSTTIRYALSSIANVKLTVYDLLGREIATLVNEEQSAGWKEVQWNASSFASGMYLVRMTALQKDGGQAGNFVETKKILLMK